MLSMYGMFGSYVVDNVAAGTDIVDYIYEQEKRRIPDMNVKREDFALKNFCLTAPAGTKLYLNNQLECTVVITQTKQLVINLDTFLVTNCTLLSECANINCRYIY